MKYFDTHTHTNYSPLSDEFHEIVVKLKEQEIGINIVGCNKETCELAIIQSKYSDNFYCSLAIHPNDINDWNNIEDMIDFLENLYLNNKNKVLCIGECGLDYYYNNDEETKQKQKNAFEAQINLAIKYNLPIMMHIRNAHKDAQEIIKKYSNLNLTWIVHCFTSNKTDALKYLELGCYLSIPGVITFKNSNDLREALKIIPLDKMLTETDAPWLTPVPYRGKINYPYYLINTNEFISNYLGIPLDVLNKKLILNACKALNIKC